ncbi:RNA polymerase sigma factor [Paenibacillus woosongensis]|uniref:RNA polymerase sigma factor n=1 Tax=Paenibacillus woosongensis TaxID=307580 RepID=A0AA95IBG9_9BACL|nr:RNA polymerase sigma factor [Paenibacillus woosongensis]WHX51493.1 RNA polymerase sigma factor [Paenibacillus woosongensis]
MDGKEGRVIEEKQLILKIQRGDRGAFRELVSQYGPYVFRVAYSVLHDHKEAEDAAQEIFLQVYKSLPGYRFEGFKTWLTRIAIHKSIDLKRKRDRRREEQWDPAEVLHIASAQEDDVLQQLMDEERKAQLRTRILTLPPAHRDIITAFYLEGKSYDDIAAEQSIAVKSVESRLYRARSWIREHWKEEEWR